MIVVVQGVIVMFCFLGLHCARTMVMRYSFLLCKHNSPS